MALRSTITLAAWILILAGGSIVLLRSIENYLVFFPSRSYSEDPLPQLAGASLEQVWLNSADGCRINAWWIRPLDPPDGAVQTFLFFHGNAGNLSDRLLHFQTFVNLGWRIFAIDYRGYGLSEGRPSERGVYSDALGAYEYLVRNLMVDPKTIFFYGESLGTAVAIYLAREHRPTGLILEAPLTSFRDVGRFHYPLVPQFVYRLMRNQWNSIDRITSVHCPLFIIHGSQDEIIPTQQGQRLFDAAALPKEIHIIPGAGHSDCLLIGGIDLLKSLQEFVSRASLDWHAGPDRQALQL